MTQSLDTPLLVNLPPWSNRVHPKLLVPDNLQKDAPSSHMRRANGTSTGQRLREAEICRFSCDRPQPVEDSLLGILALGIQITLRALRQQNFERSLQANFTNSPLENSFRPSWSSAS